MPALNFQARFADAVERGDKTQTIRAPRKRPFKVGDNLYLYTGMRTKWCRKLLDAVCIGVDPIRIERNNMVVTRTKHFTGTSKLLIQTNGMARSAWTVISRRRT